jgi:hypothetical protein
MRQRIVYRVDPVTDRWVRVYCGPVKISLPDSHREPRGARSPRGQLLHYAGLGVALSLTWLAYGWIVWTATIGTLFN